MAFRIEAKIGASLILFIALALNGATSHTYNVRHRHVHNGGIGALKIDDTGISFEESAKKTKHSFQWKYADIQELVLSLDSLRIVTYEDNRLPLGHDRVYVSTTCPPVW
jgi:hypothetical protein